VCTSHPSQVLLMQWIVRDRASSMLHASRAHAPHAGARVHARSLASMRDARIHVHAHHRQQ